MKQLVFFDATAEAAVPERQMQRRRRPFTPDSDTDGISLALPSPRFPPLNQRRSGFQED